MGNPRPDNGVRFIQTNVDPREVYAVVSAGGEPPLAFGPLAMDQIYARLYPPPDATPSAETSSAAALGSTLAARADEFHSLDDYFRFGGASVDILEWIAATPLTDPRRGNGRTWHLGGGRSEAEVARRLDIDPVRLRVAALREAVFPGSYRIGGEPMTVPGFEANWALADESWGIRINPDAYRFKAWYAAGRPVADLDRIATPAGDLPTWQQVVAAPATMAGVTAAIAAARNADRVALAALVDWPLTSARLTDRWQPGGADLDPRVAESVVGILGLGLVRAQGITLGGDDGMERTAIEVTLRSRRVPEPSVDLTAAQRDRLADLAARAAAGLDVYVVTDDQGGDLGVVVAADSGRLVPPLPDWALRR